MDDPDAICQCCFGKPGLRLHQKPVVDAVLSGKHLIGILATGGGKSLTYQIPYVLSRGITVVVSPLIALIDDQVNGLPEILRCSTVVLSGENASLSSAVNKCIDCYGRCLIYTGPEKLVQFMKHMDIRPFVTRFVLDEAHCVSEWGNTFRDAYLLLPKLWEQLGKPQIQAMTATASPGTLTDLKAMFPVNFTVIQSSVYRPNLHLTVIEHQTIEHRDHHLLMLVRNRVGPVIVYANSRTYVDRTSRWLSEVGLKSDGFHAGMSKELRTDTQHRFVNGETDILVATIAFGMGIDKADVRHVFHVEPPTTLEDYQQQVGRAGRDGNESWCVLFDTMNKRRHRIDALRSARDTIEKQDPDSFPAKLLNRKFEMERFLKMKSCRHDYLMTYSGESRSKRRCGHCDNCCGYSSGK
ncbi:MAG: RecQ family ATP-dependent DNA helicase [Armatimonadota bacterium]